MHNNVTLVNNISNYPTDLVAFNSIATSGLQKRREQVEKCFFAIIVRTIKKFVVPLQPFFKLIKFIHLYEQFIAFPYRIPHWNNFSGCRPWHCHSLSTSVIQFTKRRTLRVWYTYTWYFVDAVQSRLLSVRHPVLDV